jgi:endonuclease YncB( thermonuclease family)
MSRSLGKIIGVQLLLYWLLFLLVLLLAVAGRAQQGQSLSVEVDYIIDGDSLVVARNGKAMEVRLWGIDAPEYDQPYSDGAKNALKKMTAGQQGRLYIKYQDKYDRYVAVLFIDELNVNQELVKTGHSWVYGRYCNEPVCAHWELMQEEAKAKRRGLWRGSDPVPPWQWKSRR